jgi:hypothetical protein
MARVNLAGRAIICKRPPFLGGDEAETLVIPAPVNYSFDIIFIKGYKTKA